MQAVTKEIQLANGQTISIGMNYYALALMSKYPGGLAKLQKSLGEMEAEDVLSDKQEALVMDAFSHVLWAIVRAGGTVCTKEECMMAIGPEDMASIMDVFDEFMKRSEKMMPKN